MKMKTYILMLAIFALVVGVCGCADIVKAKNTQDKIAYRQEMASLIVELKDYAVSKKGGEFFLIGNGGAGLMEVNEYLPQSEYDKMVQKLDAVMTESVNYGWDMEMDKATPPDDQEEFHRFLRNAKQSGVLPMVLDYCEEKGNIQRSYREDKSYGYLGWTSARRELDRIPKGLPNNDNDLPCTKLSDAKNYLVLLNPEAFPTREAYIRSLAATNYDVIIVDAYYGDTMLTRDEVSVLQKKPLGGRRLVAAYMSVGEAENYRSYWQKDWEQNPPAWLWKANEDWQDNFRVRYWQEDWQKMLYGSPNSYLDGILAAGFDGAFLDVIDVFYVFEELERNGAIDKN